MFQRPRNGHLDCAVKDNRALEAWGSSFNGHGTAISIAPSLRPATNPLWRVFQRPRNGHLDCAVNGVVKPSPSRRCFNGHGTAISISPGRRASGASRRRKCFNGHGTAISIAPPRGTSAGAESGTFQRPRNGHLDCAKSEIANLRSMVKQFQRPRNGHLDPAPGFRGSYLPNESLVSTATERPSRLRRVRACMDGAKQTRFNGHGTAISIAPRAARWNEVDIFEFQRPRNGHLDCASFLPIIREFFR